MNCGVLNRSISTRLASKAYSRHFRAGSAVRFASKKKAQQPTEDVPSYFERKDARKKERSVTFQARLDKEKTLKARRDGSAKDVLKNEFKAWWDGRVQREQKWSRQAKQQGKDWKLEVAVILERLPQVMPDKEDFEKDYDELTTYLAQFGKEYPSEFAGALSQKPAPVTDEELLALLPEGFRPAPRETEADATGKTDTMDRKLKESIFLVVDGRLPSAPLNDDESLVEAAKRVVAENGGKKMDLYCPSGAPMGVCLRVDESIGDFFGTKTFYMRVQHDEGDINKKDIKGKDFEWLGRDEIVNKMQSTESRQDEPNFFRYLL
eukprot:Nitzschia sp. Nitz4//scaffold643_size2076//500//1529//NITZ4_009301-RA/size2076-augustus-gene-0.3-mRNA-1//1//CDS//3329556066//6174//frame0